MIIPPRRLPLWQAVLWVVLGAVVAQFAGWLTAGVLRSRLITKPFDPAAVDPHLVVPPVVASAGSLLLVAVVAPLVSRVPLRVGLNLRPAPPICFIAAAVGTVMLGPTADACMRAMETLLPQFNLGVVSLLHDLVREIPVLVAWPAFALLPGIAEESMFRGVLQTSFRNGVLGIVVSALAFSLFHIDPHHIAGVLPLAFFLAWVASRCGTLVTIVAHVVNNTVAIAVVHIAALDVGYGTDDPMPWPWFPASLALCAICGWIVVRTSPAQTAIIPVSEPAEL
jgi:membrane protease YdiL (CAAX protease family)